jgi:hypothetical protein
MRKTRTKTRIVFFLFHQEGMWEKVYFLPGHGKSTIPRANQNEEGGAELRRCFHPRMWNSNYNQKNRKPIRSTKREATN